MDPVFAGAGEMIIAGLSQRLHGFEQTQKSHSFNELKSRKDYTEEEELEKTNQQPVLNDG
jgi:hypothetical protein